METITKTINYTELSMEVSNWLRGYAKEAGAKGFVLGVSGGIDSAVVSTLCALSGLPLLILEMPIHQGKGEIDRARNHIQWLKDNYSNVTSQEVDLTEAYDVLYKVCGVQTVPVTEEEYDFSMANTRSRLRMTTLYNYAGTHKYLVAGTGNKVEDFGIGFYTKYGDGGVDISPIADLMKSEVYALGNGLGIHNDILTAAPTDGLHTDGRTDEDQIGATYDELEWAMSCYENGKTPASNDLTERESEVLAIYNNFHHSNKHKMESIPVFDTSKFRN